MLLGGGVSVHEMPGPCRHPSSPYCVKALGAAAGIMITASHNPPEDNGYKLYASDGAQIIPPDDEIVERLCANGGTRPSLRPIARRPGTPISPTSLFEEYRRHCTLAGRFGGGVRAPCASPTRRCTASAAP